MNQPIPTCGAKKRQGEGTCQKTAGWGTDHVGIGVCRLHGGNMGGHRKRAQRVMAEAAVAEWGVPVETTPQEAMLKTLYAASGRVAWLRRRISEYTEGHGTVASVEQLGGGQRVGGDDLNGVPLGDAGDGSGNPALLVIERHVAGGIRLTENPLLTMLRTEERHLVDIAKACHQAGIEQARIDMHKTIASLMVSILLTALPELGVTADENRIIDVVARSMLTVSAQ